MYEKLFELLDDGGYWPKPEENVDFLIDDIKWQ